MDEPSVTSSPPEPSPSGSPSVVEAVVRATVSPLLATVLYLTHHLPMGALVTVLTATVAPFDPMKLARAALAALSRRKRLGDGK